MLYIVRFAKAEKDEVKQEALRSRRESLTNTVNLLRESLKAKRVTLQ